MNGDRRDEGGAGGEEDGPLLVDGRVVTLTVQMQCLECAGVIVGNLEASGDPEEVLDEDVECPRCTRAKGQPVAIRVVVLAGSQVDEFLEPVEGEGG